MAFDGDRKVAARLGRGVQQRGGALAEDADQSRGGAPVAGRVGRGGGDARGDLVGGDALVQDGEGFLGVYQEHAEVPGTARGWPGQQWQGNGVQHAVGVGDRPGRGGGAPDRAMSRRRGRSLAWRHGKTRGGHFGWQAEGREQAGVEEGDNAGNS